MVSVTQTDRHTYTDRQRDTHMAILVYEWLLYGLTNETADREAIGILTGNAQKFSIQGVNYAQYYAHEKTCACLYLYQVSV